jgi:starch-binding outer membrane protein, SusD/RagB family
MKTRHFIILLSCVGIAGMLSSCGKKFLSTTPVGESLQDNYYKTPAQILTAVNAMYNPLGWEVGGTDNTYIDKLGALNCGSDECFAGGGGPTDMIFWQVFNNYTMTGATGPQAGMWDRNYTGINRAELVLENIAGVQGLDPTVSARYTAEAHFLRAYYYFDLVREFKNIPLILHTLSSDEIFNQVQTSPDTVYTAIEADLNAAISVLPPTVAAGELGRATKGAAQALLGKVILTENNTSRMQEAAADLEAVNGSGLYSLLPNYGDLFNPANKFNAESIFEIVHSSAGNAGWGSWPDILGNVYAQMTGPRSYSGPVFWSGGWSFNPVMPGLAALMKNDPRYSATIVNVDSLATAGAATYTAGYANTGFFERKFAPLSTEVSSTGQPELNFPNDYIEIRLADTYLMEAEALVRGGGDASKAQNYLDMVRARVGLSSIPATLDNIYAERRLELACEGHRWFDLVRTGQAATVLASKGFQAGVNEQLPLPLVELNNTKLKQNPGYK